MFTYYSSNLNTGNSVTTPWGSQNLSTKYGGANLDETSLVKTETVRGGCGSCGGGGGGGQGKKVTFFYMELDQGASPPLDEVTRIVVMDLEDGSGAEVYRQVFGLNDKGRLLRNATIEEAKLISPIRCTC